MGKSLSSTSTKLPVLLLYNREMFQKRIAMVSYHTCPLASEEGKETGGMNVYVLELSKQLVKLGYIVDVFTRSQDPGQPHIVQVMENLRVIHLAAGREKSIPKKQLPEHIPEFVKSYLSFVQKENDEYDLLHCHYYMSGLIGISINRSLKDPIPFVITFHTLALMKNLVARSELEREEKARIDAELSLAKATDAIIAPSISDKQYLEYLYGCPEEKIYIVPPGYDENIFKPIEKNFAKKHIGADKDHKIVLFVGRIEPLKGIDALIYAIKILFEKNPNLKVCLWIVGGDVSQSYKNWSKELKKLENLRKVLHITTSVKFVGQKTQEELPYYLSAAELVVIPSHYESFGMATLEAMACGTPVVTTNSSGISSLFDESFDELVTSANNPLLLASQMEHLLINEAEHEMYRRQVRKSVRNLTWENVTKRIECIYEKLLL